MGVNIVVTPHTYGAEVIFLLFCVHKDTKYDYWEMGICISQPILTHKISKVLWGNGTHNLKIGRKYCGNSSY